MTKKAKVVSPKAELAVLRAMTHKNPSISGTVIAAIDENYFYSPESVEVYRAIQRSMKDIGSTPTYRLLIEDPEISDEARDHFRESYPVVQSVADAKKAVRVLNRYKQIRGIYNLGVYIKNALDKPKVDVERVMDDMATGMNVIRSKKSTGDSFIHLGKGDSASKTIDSLLDDDRSEDLIPTGIEAFDTVAGGFARGGLVTVGADSGGGKSVMASQLAVNMAGFGYKVLLVPLEMSKIEMMARIVANVTNTDLTKILRQQWDTPLEKEKVRRKMKKWRLKCKERGGRYTIFKPEEDMTIEEVVASTNAYDYDVLIIDYISLLKGVDGDDQVRALGQVARYAKINAEVSHRVNVLLCQLNDEGKIKYSRAISEHSSNCWIWKSTEDSKNGGPTKIEQPKSRNSQSYPFLVNIIYNKMRIEKTDMSEIDVSARQDDDPKSSKKGSKKYRGNDSQLPNLATAD